MKLYEFKNECLGIPWTDPKTPAMFCWYCNKTEKQKEPYSDIKIRYFVCKRCGDWARSIKEKVK